MNTITIPKQKYEKLMMESKLYKQFFGRKPDPEAYLELSDELKKDLARSLRSKKRYSLDEVKKRYSL
ncbi:MAG TPA: hypothetical protein VJK09_03405 [Candidatus Paceibacterota bacterium]